MDGASEVVKAVSRVKKDKEERAGREVEGDDE